MRSRAKTAKFTPRSGSNDCAAPPGPRTPRPPARRAAKTASPPGVPSPGPSACTGSRDRAARPSTDSATGSDGISPGSAGPLPASPATTTAHRNRRADLDSSGPGTPTAPLSPPPVDSRLEVHDSPHRAWMEACDSGRCIARPRPAQENALRSRHRRAAIESSSSDAHRWRATIVAGLLHTTGPRRTPRPGGPERMPRSLVGSCSVGSVG